MLSPYADEDARAYNRNSRPRDTPCAPPMLSSSDLIVAPATPAGPGARAIVRLAGDGLGEPLAAMFDPEPPGFAAVGKPPRVVTARLAAGGLGRDWGPLEVEILHWPGPAGPIGGPLAEVQLPASGPLVAAVVAEACRHGCRLARGGEFTLRAFLSGRLDLVQAEAVLGVVDAATPAELASALDRLAAGSGGALAEARDQLLDLVADIEAAIDFADETTPDSVPVGPDWAAVAGRVEACDARIAAVAGRLAGRDVAATDLPRVVLVGPPNIGKSSLFNALLGRGAALVADERGTTRDWLEAALGDEAGPRCLLVDLAGLDAAAGGGPPPDTPAAAAESLARLQIGRADVLVACRDAASDSPLPAVPAAIPRIDVTTRSDSGSSPALGIATSSRTGRGIDDLKAAILTAVAGLPPRGSPATIRLAAGCDAARQALATVVEAIAEAGPRGVIDESIVAGQLRRAADALAGVTGAEIGTDLVDRIFSRHCIGK
jgi:tRNA modification GTPase